VSPRIRKVVGETFSSLHASRNFRLYLSGQLISAVGTWMTFTATSWLVLNRLHGNGAALGWNAALQFGPMLVLGAFGGVLADRYDKRKILTATQAAYAVVSLTLAAIVFTDVVQLWMVFALSTMNGIVTSLDNPSRQSFYVEMVGQETLTNAVSLNSATFTGARIIGPAMAGLLIATVGMAICFLIDGASYIAVIAALLAMHADELHRQRRSTRQRGHLVAGLRYVWSTDDLRRPLLVMAVVFTLVFQWQILVPLLATRVFDGNAWTFGFLSAAAGLGSFLAAIVMARRNVVPTMRRLGLFAILIGCAAALVGLAPVLPAAEILMIPLGFTAMTFMITGNTMLQLASRPEARGRVMALYGIVFLGSTPIGSPIVGVIGDHLGARVGFVLASLVACTMGVAVLWARQRRIAARIVQRQEAGLEIGTA
jgi:MFS family permease